MTKLRGRKLPVTWQLPPEIIALVNSYAKNRDLSKQVAAERLIVAGFKTETKQKETS